MQASQLLLLLSLLLGACASSGVYVTEGPAVPGVVVADQLGQPVDLQETVSGPWSAIFFYPKANTPG